MRLNQKKETWSMKSLNRVLLASAVATIAISPAFAADGADRTVDAYTCKDIMIDADASREAAIAFLHGYILGKSGSTKFNLDTLAKQTDAFLNMCLDNPKDKAVDVMTKVAK
jgi:hypothetical protein